MAPSSFNPLNSRSISIVSFTVTNNEIAGFIGNSVPLLASIAMNTCPFNVNIECCTVPGSPGPFSPYLAIVIISLSSNKLVYSLTASSAWLLNIKNVVIFGISMLCLL
ncbi:Uncharacterised protein [Staphylococcus aureus]|nr:Uncharacterised protein [Staphylococcus aureus]SCU53487.1 Uncharacterised protein [Staphylococcus aureus]